MPRYALSLQDVNATPWTWMNWMNWVLYPTDPLSCCPTTVDLLVHLIKRLRLRYPDTHLLVQSQAMAEPPKGAHVKKAFSDRFRKSTLFSVHTSTILSILWRVFDSRGKGFAGVWGHLIKTKPIFHVLHAASGEQFWSHKQLLNSKSVPTSAKKRPCSMFSAVRAAL